MDVEAALAVQRTKRKHALGSILLELGTVSREALEQHVAQHCLRILAEVIAWDKGTYRFEPLAPDDAERLLAEGIETTSLVLESVRPAEPAGELQLVA